MISPVAALTGATGFLGPWIAAELQARGYRVRALARRKPDPRLWRGEVPELVEGHLGEDAALSSLIGGAEVVVHAAGLIKAARPREFFQVNVEGAARVAKAIALNAPEARVLLVSSLCAREPDLSAYAASKAGAEAAVRGILRPEILTIVRPPAVYGPGDRETLAMFKALQALPVAPVLGRPDARVALIHAADAAVQIGALCTAPMEGRTYALADARPEGYGWREIVQAASAALGARRPLLFTPALGVLAVASISAAAGRIIGKAPMLTPGKARELLHSDWSVGPDELPANLPPIRFDLASGLADAVAWYRSQGWLAA